MQSSLVKLATLIVMFHMAMGCVWHHGFGPAHSCSVVPDSVSTCVHIPDDHCGSQHSHHDHAPATTEKPCEIPTDDGCQCHDDSCTFTETSKSEHDSLNQLELYFGDVLDSSHQISSANTAISSTPDRAKLIYALGVRPHLYNCVQIL